MRLVVGIGGNALIRRDPGSNFRDFGAHGTAVGERDPAEAVAALRPLAERHELVVVYGNRPQDGTAPGPSPGPGLVDLYPLDVRGVCSQAMTGYWLAQHLWLSRPLPGVVGGRPAVCLLTRILVDQHDPAFGDPTEVVGPRYGLSDALEMAAERGWQVRPDGDGWRRVVPSPAPQDVVETPYILDLLGRGVTVVCAGGGSAPVIRDQRGAVHGVEAVVDSDLTAAVLARELDADVLLLLTDVEAVERAYGTPGAVPIRSATVGELRSLDLPLCSMGPKAEAACRFVEHTGRWAGIGALSEAEAVLAGLAGTAVEPGVAVSGARPGKTTSRARPTGDQLAGDDHPPEVNGRAGAPPLPPERGAGVRARRPKTFARNGRGPVART